jgi:hypothetical protein
MAADTMPQGGWTETFDAEIIPPLALWEMLKVEYERLSSDQRAH